MPITLELPLELEEKLDELERVSGQSREDYILTALEEYLTSIEDYNDDVRFPELRHGLRKRWTAEEANKDLGATEWQ